MKKTPIVAGNWKMNKLPSEGASYINEINRLVKDIKAVEVIYAPPFTGLFDLKVKPPFHIAAQNCHWEDCGALTGEISLTMIKDCGAEYVILGHSERRHIFNETDEWVNNKIRAVLKNDLKPILCIGETIEQRENGATKSILENQLEKGLSSIEKINKCVIAYEPVWAIGTGLTATNDQVETAHEVIRDFIRKKFKNSNHIHILYGGSVNSDNAKSLIKTKGVDGFLIGGASLDAESFASIINIVEEVQEI